MNQKWKPAQRKRWALFVKGAVAATKVFGTVGLYKCPLCFRDFDMQHAILGKELTLEHVPPRVAGGRPYVLTCHDCNNIAGTLVDSQVKRRYEFAAFLEVLAGLRIGESIRATFEFEGIDLNVEVIRHTASKAEISVLGEQNDPKIATKLQKLMKHKVDNGTFVGSEMHITSKVGYDKRLADISDLRAAYLGAFATFGYSLILRKSYQTIKNQLQRHGIR